MPIGDLLAQITGEPSPTLPPTTQYIPKRKASGDLVKSAEKVQRTNNSIQLASSSRPVAQPIRPSALDSAVEKTHLARKPPIPSPTANFNNGRPTPPPTSDPVGPTKPPKKGSFAEIMARGKQAQANLGQVGKIQHKKIEKAPTKREREDMKKQKTERIQKNLGPVGKFKSAVSSIAGRTGEKKETRAPIPDKKPKKAAAATTGYAGTARPKPGSGTSTLNHTASSSSRYQRAPDRYRNDQRSSSNRRDYDGEEEDEQDYDSDASSDMEAAAFEVDEEEEKAARIARKEDAEALIEENRLKREKEEKRRRLAAMAKGRR